MAESVGGFFASLRLQTDEASFRRGFNNLTNTARSLANLIRAGLGIAGVTLGLKAFFDAANQQGKFLLTADYLDMSAQAFLTWRGAITEAGASADAFIESMKGLHQIMIRIFQEGSPENASFFKNIAMLIGAQNMAGFQKMSTEQQVRTLMNAAVGARNKDLANDLILQLLGPEALQTVLAARRTPGGLEGMLGRARRRIYETPADMAGAQRGMQDLRQVTDSLHNMWAALSAKELKALAPSIERLAKWLEDHQDDITRMIDAMVDLTTTIIGSFNSKGGLGRLVTGKATKDDWFPQGLPWEGRFWKSQSEELLGFLFPRLNKSIVPNNPLALNQYLLKVELDDNLKLRGSGDKRASIYLDQGAKTMQLPGTASGGGH